MATLQAHLETFGKEELKQYARILGLGLSSSLRKTDLAGAIAGALLGEDTLRRRMGTLTDEQIRLFERAMQAPLQPAREEMGDAFRLDDLHYGVYSGADSSLWIPEDVAEAYRRISCRAFHFYRRRTAWLMKCLYFAETLFGVTPIDHLYSIYLDHPCFKVSRERFLYYLIQIPADLRDCHMTDKYVVAGPWLALEECRRLLGRQADRDYYLPGFEEVETLWRENCLTGTPGWEALEKWIGERLPPGRGEASDVTCELWNRLAGGAAFGETALFLAGEVLSLGGESAEDLLDHLRSAAGETRMLENRGFTRQELLGREDESALLYQVMIMPGSTRAACRLQKLEKQLRNKGIHTDYAIRAETREDLPGGKIYPADPCPCGSRLPYIRCCGKGWTMRHALE